jgi:hypothetical protein
MPSEGCSGNESGNESVNGSGNESGDGSGNGSGYSAVTADVKKDPQVEQKSVDEDGMSNANGKDNQQEKKREKGKGKEKKEKEKKPLTVGESLLFLCVGGQVVYLTVASFAATVTNTVLGEETALQLDQLFTQEDTSMRKVVNSIQFLVRSVMTGACLIGGAGFLFFGSFLVGAAGGGYLWLSCENGDIKLLKHHRRDIVLLFLIGIPPGWLLWNVSEVITGKPAVEFMYIGITLLFSATVALYKFASDSQDKIDKGKPKKVDSTVNDAVGDMKIGTASVNGGKTNDVTVSDAVQFTERMTSSTDSRVETWSAKDEISLMKLSRMMGGVMYGYSLQIVVFFFSITAMPIVRNIVTGEESFLLNYWRNGIRATID